MKTDVEIVNTHTFKEKESKDVLRFGKYKGSEIKDVLKITELKNGKLYESGKNYLEWLIKQEWLKKEMKDSINFYLK